jgi:putative cell wall-binding protein
MAGVRRSVAVAIAAATVLLLASNAASAAPSPRQPNGTSGASPGKAPSAVERPLPVSAPAPIRGVGPDRLRRWTSRHDDTTVTTGKSQSTNWSGEIDSGTGFTSASASWTVPTVAASATPQSVATWIGIGGAASTTGLVQVGTDEFTTSGVTAYAAWYEILPAPQVALTGTVEPGDVMHASITEARTDSWRIQIEDVTRGWVASGSVTYDVGPADSAEWITERPEVTTKLATLADYHSSRFSELEVAQGAGASSPDVSDLTAIEMVDTTGEVISYPGAVATSPSGSTVSFTDHFVAPSSRIYGATADATAAAELEHQFTSVGGHCPGTTAARPVILATDRTYPDALASAYLARSLGTGTLLTPTGSLSTATLTAIRKEGITHVYVVGGPFAVSTTVVDQLESTTAYDCGGESLAPGRPTIQVTRIFGQTEYDTARAIAEFVQPPHIGAIDIAGAYAGTNAAGGDGRYNTTAGAASSFPSSESPLSTAIIATGAGFQDAESASTLAYADELPILLTTPSALSPQASSAIRTLGIAQVIVMGGQFAVSNAVVTQLESLGVSVLRVAGSDDTGTAVELAELETTPSSTAHLGLGWSGTGSVTVARGDFFTDGLAGAVVAADGPTAASPEPLLLTVDPTTVGTALSAFLVTAGKTGLGGKVVMRMTILGGPFAVTATTAMAMGADLGV